MQTEIKGRCDSLLNNLNSTTNPLPSAKTQKMTNEQIEKFLTPNHLAKQTVKINFKSRNPIMGLFIELTDYKELRDKNFWRVVTEKNIDTWKKSRDMNLVKIFNGAEFTKLAATG